MPVIKADASGNVHLAWMGKTDGVFDILYSGWNGERWSGPIKVTNGMHESMFPSMAIDSSGEANLV